VADHNKITYGLLPQHLIDEYNTNVARLWDMKKEILEPLKKAIKNAMIKYAKTKDPASQHSITTMRQLID